MSFDCIRCPVCRNNAKSAKATALQSIVKKDLKYLVIDEPYYFCSDDFCEVVFFNEESDKVFLLEDVNLSVEPNEKSGCGCTNNGCKSGKGCCNH